jgi:hypothetical protein
MRARNTWTRFVCGALPLALGACLAPPVETPVTTTVQETDVRVEQSVKNKVDILFMVDDSNSMDPKQAALRMRFPELVKILDTFGAMGSPAWYHIGVVTSDLGAGMAPNGGCAVGGLGGRLQPLGRAHAAGCQPPGNGLNFIDYNQLNMTGGVPASNLPTGVSLQDEFTCMATVGTGGCGFEHQLESVYRALHDCQPAADGSYPNCTIPANQGFLRPDSILAVVWVTDEDDCSAPDNTDLFDQAKTSMYGFDASFRCSNYGVQCNGMLLPYADSGGPLTNCVSAPNPNGMGPGKLFDISRYVDFFKNSSFNNGGGVRADPSDVILAAIDAPNDPVQTVIGNMDMPDMSSPGGYGACASGAMVGTQSCSVLLGHSCFASSAFFGDPAVRINQVLNEVDSSSQITSICAQDYTSALQALGMKIISKIGIACLSSPITDPSNPDCVVEDRSNTDDSVVDSIPSCASTGNQQPCWAYQENDQCAKVVNPVNNTVTQGSIAVNRDQMSIPPGTHLRVACATIAHTSGGTMPSPSP